MYKDIKKTYRRNDHPNILVGAPPYCWFHHEDNHRGAPDVVHIVPAVIGLHLTANRQDAELSSSFDLKLLRNFILLWTFWQDDTMQVNLLEFPARVLISVRVGDASLAVTPALPNTK